MSVEFGFDMLILGFENTTGSSLSLDCTISASKSRT
jgi:hypothetical protein